MTPFPSFPQIDPVKKRRGRRADLGEGEWRLGMKQEAINLDHDILLLAKSRTSRVGVLYSVLCDTCVCPKGTVQVRQDGLVCAHSLGGR